MREITIFQLLIVWFIPIIVIVIIMTWNDNSDRQELLNKIGITYVIVALFVLVVLIFSAECSLYPFSKYKCYDIGYRHGSGKTLDK